MDREGLFRLNITLFIFIETIGHRHLPFFLSKYKTVARINDADIHGLREALIDLSAVRYVVCVYMCVMLYHK